MRSRHVRSSVTAVVLALLLGSCTGTSPEPADPSGPDTEPSEAATTSAPPTADGPAPLDVAAQTVLHCTCGDIDASVYPVVRDGDTGVLTVDLATDTDEDVSLGLLFAAAASPTIRAPGTIRLLDAAGGQMLHPATDSAGETVGNEGWNTVRADGTRLQIVYAAPESDTVSLLLPGAELVTDVPVVEGEAPSAPAYTGLGDVESESYEPGAPQELPTFALGRLTQEYTGALSTVDDPEVLEVTLETDFLFDVDSAELEDGAGELLDRAADIITSREAESVQVIGHTDDVGTRDYNQGLSEDRAGAVEAELSSRLGDDAPRIVTEGRSFSDPVATNGTEAGRAANRRVEVVVEAPRQEAADVSGGGELPEFEDGPVGTAAEGVEVEYGSHRWEVSALGARPLEDYVVVDLQVTNADDSGSSPNFLSSVWSYRGDDARYPQQTIAGVTVLSGATQLFPADYSYGEVSGTTLWATASDLSSHGTLEPGESRTFSLVYPRPADAESLTLQLDASLGSAAFRLTDLPVG